MHGTVSAPSDRDNFKPAVLRGGEQPDLLRSETLIDVFRASAGRLPDKIAIQLIGSSQRFTYGELDRASRRVACALRSHGIARGDRVGLWLPRSLDLHVALLGILAAGATYIPFDSDTPARRVAECLADCRARWLICPDGKPLEVDGVTTFGIRDLDQFGPADNVPPAAATPDHLAYIIYTSGSTGRPKGIEISHRSICHYLRAGNLALGIVEGDVVLQNASIAFDLSLEEIFVPYLVGATLKVAPPGLLQQSRGLAETLESESITVVDTVPTLLALMEREPVGVRLIIVGGEACPNSIVERFARDGRRIVNTYGPTEATVVATTCDLRPGEPITIGTPIANSAIFVVDEAMRILPVGEVGELLIGGPGVAKGYVNQPGPSALKFIDNPFPEEAGRYPVLFRSGDAVRVTAAGTIEFHGRIDTQVKIRGHRIELGEIEVALGRQSGVQLAAVVVHRHPNAGERLVAHVVADGGFDLERTRAELAACLPAYMLPQHWHLHGELPRLSSGKIDRNALAAVPVAATGRTGPVAAPSTKTEAILLKAAHEVLGQAEIDLDADFFEDLGGHSLLAANFVSEVRKTPSLAGIALKDVYGERSLRKLAAALDARRAAPTPRQDLAFEPPPFMRRFLCGVAQAVALPFIIAIVTLQWMGLLLSSIYLIRSETPFWKEVLILCAIYVALNLGSKLIVVGVKWLVIGRTKPGVYPLWGSYYFRIWLMQRVVHLSGHKFLQGTPLMPIYLRALGARVGRDAIIHEFEEGAIDLVSIGDRASIGQKVRFANVEVIGNEVFVGRIVIGDDAVIGNACVVGGDVEIAAGAEICDLTSVPASTVVGAAERWDGAPGRLVGRTEPMALPPHPSIGPIKRLWLTVCYFVTYNLVMMIGLLPIFPAFYILTELDDFTFGDRDNVVPWHWVFLFAWPSAIVLIFCSVLLVVAMRWTLLPSVSPGAYSIYSAFYFRKWMMTLATETMLETLNSLYATLFMRHWYRLMGTKIGHGTEISSNFAGRYDLIELGDNNFIGDETIFGDEEVRGGWMSLDRVKTGNLCFFGNLSVIPMGAQIEDGALIGVKSKPPPGNRIAANETWFGSPPIEIPNRQRVTLGDNLTYLPPVRMRALRTVFETLHTSLPTAVLITLAYISADLMEFSIDGDDWITAIATFFAAGLFVSIVMVLVSIAFKWLLMGVYRPTIRPMWSWWSMRTEAVAVLYGGLSSKVMLDYLRGTPFLPMMLRLYGTKIGKGVWINSPDLTEFDCVEIGDFSVINMLSSPQTHLYEDRVMKVGRIKIGRGVTIGTAAIVLYDSEVGDFARLAPLTVVMKGEFIPPHTAWTGAPARLVVTQTRTFDHDSGAHRPALVDP